MPKGEQPYSIYVFLGEVTGRAAEWAGHESFVGLTSTLGTHSDVPVKGSVDVTEALEKKIEAGETTAEKAVDYLKANLRWRVLFVSRLPV